MTVLPADLELDASAALAQADALRDAIEQGLSEGGEAGVEQIGAAISSADFTVPVDIDTSLGEAGLQDFEALAESAAPTISVDADIEQAEARVEELAALAEATDATVTVDADTANAEAAVEGLTGTLEDSGGAAESAGSKFGGAGSAASFLGGAVGAARGEVSGLAGAVEGVGGSVGGLAKGLGVGAAAFTAFFLAGEKSIAADERLNVVLGDTADQVKNINVGGLTGDLGDLAIQSGSSGAQLKQAAANMAQLALSAGASTTEATRFTNQVSALSLRAAAMNPQLGEAGAVADRLGLALARGGRFAARFGLDLNAAEIQARAMADTGKTTAAQLTQYEKSAAGAAIATERLGASIGDDFKKGSEQSSIQLRALEKQLISTFAQAGRPLVEPTIEALKELAPIGESLARILGSLATSVLPLVAAGFGAIGAVVGPIADGMGALPDPILAAAAALTLLVIAQRAYAAQSSATATGTSLLGNSFALLTNPLVAIPALMVGAGLGLAFLFGAFDESTSHAEKLSEALEGQRKTLVAHSDTVAGAAKDVDDLDRSFAKYIHTSSAFRGEEQVHDLERWGISITELRRDLEGGAEGFRRFFAEAKDTGHIKAEFDGVQLSADQFRQVIEKGRVTVQGHTVDLRNNAVALNRLKIDGDKVTDTFLAEQEALAKVNRETLSNLQATGELPPAYAAFAIEANRAKDGTINWAGALDDATHAATNILPFLTQQQFELARSSEQFNAFAAAATSAAGNLPTVGSLLSKAADDIKQFTGTLDPALVTQHLGEMFVPIQDFFNNVSTLAQTGSTNLATALLQIGPEAGAGLAQSLVDSAPEVQAGAEAMVSGITDAMFGVQVQLQVAAEKAKVIAGEIGQGTGESLKAAFGAVDFGQLQNIPLDALKTAADALSNDTTLPSAGAALVKHTTGAMHAEFGKAPEVTTEALDAIKAALDAGVNPISEKSRGLGQAGVFAFRAGFSGMKQDADTESAAAAAAPGAHAEEAREGGRQHGAATKEGAAQGRRGMDTEAAADSGKAAVAAAAEGTRHTGLMAEAGRALSHGLATGIGEGTEQVKGAARALATEGASGARNTGAWSDAGAAAGGAYANAIDSGANVSAAQAAGRHLARAAADAGKNAGDSPTTHLWIDAASDIGEAYAITLAAQEDRVAQAARQLARAAADAVAIPITPRVNLGAISGGQAATTARGGTVTQTTVQVRSGAVQLTLHPPAGATPAQVGEMAREATSSSIAELRSELAALGS